MHCTRHRRLLIIDSDRKPLTRGFVWPRAMNELEARGRDKKLRWLVPRLS